MAKRNAAELAQKKKIMHTRVTAHSDTYSNRVSNTKTVDLSHAGQLKLNRAIEAVMFMFLD